MPEKINLLIAIGLSPENAEDYFRSKGYAFSWNWKDVWQQQHSQAFTVAKVMQLDLLKDIRELVDEAISGKITTEEFYKKLEPKLRAKGWWGKVKAEDVPGYDPKSGIDPETEVQLGSPWRMKKIIETNMNVSYAAGRYKTQTDASSFAPWWRYRDMDDDRVRVKHRAVGKIFTNAVLHYTNPFWQNWYPPNDWGCRCWVENYTEAEAKEKGFTFLTAEEFLVLAGKIGVPAEGWAYNPGEAWKPDLTKYPPELIKSVGL